jgi:hypothetical protein
MLINLDNEHFRMMNSTRPGFRMLTQATHGPLGGFVGYFIIYLTGDDLAVDQPHYREDRRSVAASSTLMEALNMARQRGADWIEANGG